MILIGQYDSPFDRRVTIAMRLYGRTASIPPRQRRDRRTGLPNFTRARVSYLCQREEQRDAAIPVRVPSA